MTDVLFFTDNGVNTYSATDEDGVSGIQIVAVGADDNEYECSSTGQPWYVRSCEHPARMIKLRLSDSISIGIVSILILGPPARQTIFVQEQQAAFPGENPAITFDGTV